MEVAETVFRAEVYQLGHDRAGGSCLIKDHVAVSVKVDAKEAVNNSLCK